MDIVGGAKTSCYEYDYPSSGLTSDIPTPAYRFEDLKVQYNQSIKDIYGCTRYAVMTAIANNRGVKWDTKDFDMMRSRAPSYGRAPKEGMFLSKAGDMVVDYLNELYPDQVRKKGTINLYEQGPDYMKLGYMVHMGSIINKRYLDIIKDGLIEEIWGKVGEGHSRCVYLNKAYEAKGEVENYVGVLAHNVIDIGIRDTIETQKQYYTQAFVYYPTGKIMPPIEIEYDHGTTPSQQEIVHAREKEIQQGYKPHFSNYIDEYYITRMLIDIDGARSV